jgi:hypothetical protein
MKKKSVAAYNPLNLEILNCLQKGEGLSRIPSIKNGNRIDLTGVDFSGKKFDEKNFFFMRFIGFQIGRFDLEELCIPRYDL